MEGRGCENRGLAWALQGAERGAEDERLPEDLPTGVGSQVGTNCVHVAGPRTEAASPRFTRLPVVPTPGSRSGLDFDFHLLTASPAPNMHNDWAQLA